MVDTVMTVQDRIQLQGIEPAKRLATHCMHEFYAARVAITRRLIDEHRSVLADQSNTFVWFDELNAVALLRSQRPHWAPEPWPFGL